MSEPQNVRRLLLASTSDGITIGVVRPDDVDVWDIHVEDLKRGPTLGMSLVRIIEEYAPTEVLALFPGPGAVRRDVRTDKALSAALTRADCPRSNVIYSWNEFKKLERQYDSDDQAKSACFTSLGQPLIHRLYLLQRAAAAKDEQVGEDRSLTYGVLMAHYEKAVEAAAYEQQRRIEAEKENDEYRKIIANLEGMNESLRAALAKPTSH